MNLRLVVLAVFLLSLSFSGILSAHEKTSQSLINPLRKYHRFKALRPFTPALKALTDQLVKDGYAKEAAVYFRSFNDGVWIGINERVRFAPASLMKVPVMMVYLKKAERNPAVLSEPLTVADENSHSQFIPSKIYLQKGDKRTVEELIGIMIRHSDNDAMKTLIENADVKEVLKMYDQLGYSAFVNEGDFISLKAYAGTFRVLYNATFLNEEMSEKALSYLADTDFARGIRASIPESVTLVHKFGEYASPETQVKQLHDVGIVYHPDNPYLIGIMTRGDDYEKLAHTIEKISGFIYQEVDRQYKQAQETDFAYGFEEEA